MYILFSILILVTCILLILIVLVQNSKGGGLSATFGGGQSQTMGVKKTADFLEKATWTLAVALLVFSLLATMSIPREEEQNKSVIEEQIDNAVDPSQNPTFPTSPGREGQGSGDQNIPVE